jgi:site-specific DNA-methyltransferase (adenine-specific)
MGGVKADMVFTDPPYGINMQRSGSIKNDTMDVLPKIFEQAIANLFAVAKEGASIYIWVGFRAYSLAEKELLKFRDIANCIVWKKPSIGMGKKGFRFQHELCLFSGEVESNSVSDVWEANRDTSGIHPTIKPIELVEKAVVNSSKSGDFLIDLFGGSGSTLIACEKTNRNAYLMELDPKYCDVIVQRWEDFTGKKAELLS